MKNSGLLSFAPSDLMAAKSEDFFASSISLIVSNASIDLKSVTGASSSCSGSGNPDSDGLSLSQEFADKPDDFQSRKERLTAWQIPKLLGYVIILRR